MHFFAQRDYSHAKVFDCPEQLVHVSKGSKDDVIVTIDGLEILGHPLIDLGFKIRKLARGATVKLVVNLYRDFLHAFKVALKSLTGQAAFLLFPQENPLVLS